jgi:hypothetical protein
VEEWGENYGFSHVIKALVRLLSTGLNDYKFYIRRFKMSILRDYFEKENAKCYEFKVEERQELHCYYFFAHYVSSILLQLPMYGYAFLLFVQFRGLARRTA